MKLMKIALASALALTSTIALAGPVHRPGIRVVHHQTGGTFRLHPNYGNPNGNPDGPTTLSGTGSSQFGGSSAGTSGDN